MGVIADMVFGIDEDKQGARHTAEKDTVIVYEVMQTLQKLVALTGKQWRH